MTRISRTAIFILLLSALLLGGGCERPQYQTLDGDSGRFSELQGKWLVINYWATWCKPCYEEIPELNDLRERYPGKVRVLGVNYDGLKGEELRAAVAQMGIEFDTLLEDPAPVFDYPVPNVLPTTAIIDPEGRLVDTLLGPQTLEMLETATEREAS